MSWTTLLFLLTFSSPLNAALDNETLMVLSTTSIYANMTRSSGAFLLRNNTDLLKDVTFCWRFFQFRTVSTYTMIISAASDEGILLQFYVVASESTHFYRFFYSDIGDTKVTTDNLQGFKTSGTVSLPDCQSRLEMFVNKKILSLN